MEAGTSLQGQYGWCLVRTLTLCVNAFVFALSQFYLPLPIVHSINCSAPIFAILFDFLLNGARLQGRHLLGVGLTTAGILLILCFEEQPSFSRNMTTF